MKSYSSPAEAYHDMMFNMGLALTQWQIIEHNLFNLYRFLYGESDSAALNVTFHEMGLDIKLRAIQSLIELRTNDKKVRKTWAHTVEALYKQKRLRDKLAHWTVMGGTHPEGGFISYLSPPSSSLKATRMAEGSADEYIDGPTLQDRAIKEFGFVAAAIQRFATDFH